MLGRAPRDCYSIHLLPPERRPLHPPGLMADRAVPSLSQGVLMGYSTVADWRVGEGKARTPTQKLCL